MIKGMYDPTCIPKKLLTLLNYLRTQMGLFSVHCKLCRLIYCRSICLVINTKSPFRLLYVMH